ncbi:MAG TPA: DUF3570 domain-containing protein [Polyangiaceae bacterium]|jgi:hypothetical protein|nr:DUF3570 domain-containing protein [Polyangiaceae bacterium]
MLGVCAVLAALPAYAQSADTSAEPGGHPRAELHLGRDGSSDHASSANDRRLQETASMEIGTYVDSDNVFVFTPTVAGSIANELAGWRVSGRYLVDVVSAASADVVSTASPPFTEVRNAGTLEGTYKPHSFGVTANAAVSFEPDYTSVLGGVSFTKDLLDKNLTLTFGYSHLHDIAGRTGTPFSVFSRVLDRDALKLGTTIVASRSTIVSIVTDVMIEYGDPSKPYRYVPMFAPGTDVPRGASIDVVTQLRLPDRVLEQLPLRRDRLALSAGFSHRFRKSTLRMDELLYADTWDLKGSATDARWLFDIGRRFEIGPHVRFYGQTSVSFWQRAYTLVDHDYPALRTGNRELGPLLNFTGGGSARAAIGRHADPRAWVLGVDANVTSTQYLDDIYLTQRLSFVGSLSLEAAL